MKNVNILAIDGGGIRGIIPAMVLAEIEQKTGKPIAELFQLVAGTSTGAIITLALTKPSPSGEPSMGADELATLYETDGPTVFKQSPLRWLMSLGNLVDEKYSLDNLRALAQKYLGDTFLRDALTDIMIPVYDIENATSYFFKSHKARDETVCDFKMVDILLAAASAPTYFEPVQLIEPETGKSMTLIDGGIFANNPAMAAYVEARKMYPDADQFVLISLGTGMRTKRISYEQAKGWGIIEWAEPILSVVFDGISDTIDYQLQKILSAQNELRSYHRFQAELPLGSDKMDNASRYNIQRLKLVAQEMIMERGGEIDLVCEKLL